MYVTWFLPQSISLFCKVVMGLLLCISIYWYVVHTLSPWGQYFLLISAHTTSIKSEEEELEYYPRVSYTVVFIKDH